MSRSTGGHVERPCPGNGGRHGVWTRYLAAALCGGCLAVLFSPFLARAGVPALAYAALGMRATWSIFCHQMPSRTPVVLGCPLCTCFRCTGIVLGALAASILHLCRRSSLTGRSGTPESRDRRDFPRQASIQGKDGGIGCSGIIESQTSRGLRGGEGAYGSRAHGRKLTYGKAFPDGRRGWHGTRLPLTGPDLVLIGLPVLDVVLQTWGLYDSNTCRFATGLAGGFSLIRIVLAAVEADERGLPPGIP